MTGPGCQDHLCKFPDSGKLRAPVDSTLVSPLLSVISQLCCQYCFFPDLCLNVGGLGQAPESSAFCLILLAGKHPSFGLQRPQSQGGGPSKEGDGFKTLKTFVLKVYTDPKPRGQGLRRIVVTLFRLVSWMGRVNIYLLLEPSTLWVSEIGEAGNF